MPIDWEAVTPLAPWVIIAPDLSRSKAGDIFLPEMSRRRARQGIVVAVYGQRCTKKGVLVKAEVKEGDRVIFQRAFGQIEETEDGEYLLIPEANILAIREADLC